MTPRDTLAALLHGSICEYHWPDLLTCGIDHADDADRLLAAGVRVAPSPDAPRYEVIDKGGSNFEVRFAATPAPSPDAPERCAYSNDRNHCAVHDADWPPREELCRVAYRLALALPPRDALDVERLAAVIDKYADDLYLAGGPTRSAVIRTIAREYAAQSEEPTP